MNNHSDLIAELIRGYGSAKVRLKRCSRATSLGEGHAQSGYVSVLTVAANVPSYSNIRVWGGPNYAAIMERNRFSLLMPVRVCGRGAKMR